MTKQQKLVLLVSILASFVAFLDIAVVNVALPAIQKELGGGLSTQQWVVDAYLLTLGSLILIAGSLSDLFGRKRILQYGLAGFGLTSLLCAIAPSPEFLIVCRALQGIAGALLVPSSLALIISTFSGTAQGKAIGTWTAWTGISFIAGPLIGGVLVDQASWRWIFAINLLPIIITLWLLRSVLANPRKTSMNIVDFWGSALCALGLGGAVYALIEQPRYGWLNAKIYLPLILGLAFFSLFIWHERRTKYPMLPLGIFKNHNFSVGNIATTAIYSGLTASTFLIIVFVQQVGSYSALSAGLTLLPVTILMFVLSPRMGTLSAKYGPRLFMSLGPVLAGVGFLLMLKVSPNLDYWTQLFPGVLIFGLGLSITVSPLTAAILGDVQAEHAGIASAINNAIARVAGLIAVAAVGAVVAASFSSSLNKNFAAQTPAEHQATAQAREKSLSASVPAGISSKREFKQAIETASVSAFRSGITVMAGLIILGGIISAIGIQNKKT